jgi:microcystin-dependent protein
LQITQYSALFSLLGTQFGGDGVNTFGLPDLQERVPLHAGQGQGLPNYVIGQKEGSPTVTLQTANLPAHVHQITPPVSNANGTSSSPVNTYPAVDVTTVTGGARGETAATSSHAASAVPGQSAAAFPSGSTGNGTPVSIEPPYQVVNFIIALVGLYPTRG